LLGVQADPTPIIKSVLWIIYINVSITIISARKYLEFALYLYYRIETVNPLK
jgi:hypothetical protein